MFIYGDSYGDVGNRALATQGQSDAYLFNMLAHKRAMDQLGMNAGAANNDANYRWQSLMAQIAAQKQQQDYLKAHMAQTQGLDLLKLGQQNQQFREQMNLANRQFDDTQTQKDYGEATQAVQSGLVRPEDLTTQFPSLGPTHVGRLTDYHQSLSEMERADQEAANHISDNLNAQLQLKRRLAHALNAYQKEKENLSFWNRFVGRGKKDIEADVQKVSHGQLPLPTQEADLGPADVETFLAGVTKNQKLAQHVQFDPETQRFAAIPKPFKFYRPKPEFLGPPGPGIPAPMDQPGQAMSAPIVPTPMAPSSAPAAAVPAAAALIYDPPTGQLVPRDEYMRRLAARQKSRANPSTDLSGYFEPAMY